MGNDVFVSVRARTGYSIYRLDADFKNPAVIVKGLRGCCGQMDFTARDGVVYVAANCNFKVQKYDRAGKKLGDFGKRASGRGKAVEEAFDGCCEPKNVAFDTDGNLLVAESDACCVKRFSPDGRLPRLRRFGPGHHRLRAGDHGAGARRAHLYARHRP